jgi:hypothetical protein
MKRDGGKHQREGIGKVVAGIGEERKAVRTETRDEFHRYEQERRGKRPFQDATGPMIVMMMCQNNSASFILQKQRVQSQD